ncbi:MAG: [FeFe] hydrogenase H-cluster radical SAM maturase HydE, partial [Calditrichia bacterium]
GTVVLQSGEDPCWTSPEVENLIFKIKERTDLAITLSLGERPRDEYERWFRAGADRYLLKEETFNSRLYKRLHPDMQYAERYRCLQDLREIGYQVGGGCMLGLPGQTVADVADDLLFLRKFNMDMAGIGPFIAHPGTPLGSFPSGAVEFSLLTLAVARILLKDTHLPATTALQTLDDRGLEKALQCGANVIMPNFTPAQYRELYEIYPGKRSARDNSEIIFQETVARIKAAGREIGTGKGHSYKLHSDSVSA